MKLDVIVPNDIYSLDKDWFRDVIDDLGGCIVLHSKEKEGQKFEVLFFYDDEKMIDTFINRYPCLSIERR